VTCAVAGPRAGYPAVAISVRWGSDGAWGPAAPFTAAAGSAADDGNAERANATMMGMRRAMSSIIRAPLLCYYLAVVPYTGSPGSGSSRQ
jgi:hypothetical protein